MCISLYTSRVVLNALGVLDYGINNVVGGVISMMGLINSSMTVSTQRFLNYAMGKNDMVLLNKYFSSSFFIFLLLCILFFVLSETIGLWIINTKLVIPDNRIYAAICVFQFSILSTIVSLLTNPYSSAIIAHEKMSIYAYISIFDACLKLSIAFLITNVSYDRLITYSFLLLSSTIIQSLIYVIFCLYNFKECKLHIIFDKHLYKEVLSFSGWNLFGAMSNFVKGQGLNILLNMFFNPAVNAARGIAYQVNNAISNFYSNFYMAARPQLIQYYAGKEYNSFFLLLFRSARLSFFLVLIFSLPLILETNYIIQLWLGRIPDYVVPFFRLIIIITAIDAIVAPLNTASSATGNVKIYQIVLSSLNIANLPISYLCLKFGHSPIIVFQISLSIAFINLFVRAFLIKRLIKNFPIKKFFIEVYLNLVFVSALSFSLSYLVKIILPDSNIMSLVVCLWSFIITLLTILCIGLNIEERKILTNKIRLKLHQNA